MQIRTDIDAHAWDDFLSRQPWRPFLQSWTMGDVYQDIGQPPVRVAVERNGMTIAVCFAHIVPARRGKHLSVPYGPLFAHDLTPNDFDELLPLLFGELKKIAAEHGCTFIRMSPFLEEKDGAVLMSGLAKANIKTVRSPLHLLAEHVWHLPLQNRSAEQILADMRKTTRNLIGRAGRDGVSVTASDDPVRDLPLFIALHDETRKRHGFTPYTNAFFRAQVARFAPRKECTLYIARYQEKVIAASVHMHAMGETSYHHGASDSAHAKVPASYLLQWTAITDAIKRGDKTYNFWGIAPLSAEGTPSKNHPFAGVTLFKTGFGGELLNLMHCVDIPVTGKYWLTYAFERFRKWRRGF